jgi:L-ascorbate metabolism protein UlaG (beta-lactamase superfamily)
MNMIKWLIIFGTLLSANTHSMLCMESNLPISIRYLGVGALDINFKHQRLLTDPFYSPQSIWNIVSIDKYRPNSNAIKSALGTYKKNVGGVLVGHGHYDHLADLPAIKNYLTDDAIIVGSTSATNMIAPTFCPFQNTMNINGITWQTAG